MLHCSMEARQNATKQQSSGRIQDAMNPSRGIRDDISRRGGKPRNHHQENLVRIKQAQQLTRLKEQQAETERIMNEIQRAKTRVKFSHVASKFREPKMSPSSSVEDASVYSEELTQAPKYPSSQTVYVPPVHRRTKVGQLPKYLVERKEGWAKERAQKLEQEKQVKEGGGPGMVALPDQERQEMLRGLETAMEMTLKEISKLPIAIKTEAHKLRQLQLEEKVESLEKTIESLRGKRKIWIRKTPGTDASTRQSSAYSSSASAMEDAMQPQKQQHKSMEPEENISNWLKRK